MNERLKELESKRQKKIKVYNATPSNSWKRKLIKMEIEIIEGRIKIEKLKQQFK